LINNRQNGRRRGRGGGQRSPSNISNPGNRQDNRQRGNAAQLHEKYKAMARDAQLSGDRVQTEYYLQFADHYYRVLNEGRARFEEQRRQQRDEYGAEEGEEQDVEALAAERDGDERQERYERPERRERQEREPRREQADYRNGSEPERSFEQPAVEAEEEAEERISLDVLPPAISSEAQAEAPRPRRRTRRPRPDDGEEIAPAA